ncbi:MAG: hypothetical protein WCF04_03650 [Candidatus Nanopelagicales bacterium]
MVLLAATAAPVDIGIAVEPVDVVEGSVLGLEVRIESQRDLVVRGGEVALVTRVAYKHREGNVLGGSSTKVVRRTDVHAVHPVPGPWPLPTSDPVVLPVRIAVPATGPGTAHSELVDIAWAARVRLQVQGHLVAEASRTFVVRSRAASEAGRRHSEPVLSKRSPADLRIVDLSTRSLGPGSPVTGTLVIGALRPFPVRGVRLALVLRQQVHHGQWHVDDPTRNPANEDKDQDTELVVANLAGPLDLDPGTPMRIPFRLVAPLELPAPSLSTPHFRLGWLLRAVLDRPLRPDPFTEVDLHVRTTLD